MADRISIEEELLDNINGGAITYTWNGQTGSLGIDGKNIYTLHDKEAYLKVYNENFGKKNDLEIIKILKQKGIITKP